MKDLEIHLNAPEGASPEELAAYLDEVCGEDAALRARVEALFAADAQAHSGFLEGPSADVDTTIDSGPEQISSEEGSGAVIGRYKLLEKLGEGGFGSVWAAEQREPVKRRVALKIVKLGMDTKQVVARFEAERQALALMDHPNIAKVLDAGTTEAGRPFFVMELVKGIPITDYFDQERTLVAEKLKLFIRVCQAIQHAHQKGVIHRDIKPSNVMVTLHDGEPVPKVIDFGIAKATQGDLTDKTIYTQYSQFIGTPAYMSPEQAEMSGLDVDTRSDIYSLGVLLYEVLTGVTPFDTRELMSSGVDEMRKIIRERDPVKPSTRLSQLTGTGQARRLGAPEDLALASDLDWIVMKAIEKDRTRRYETAIGLAKDVERYLIHEPVLACPPSTAYRFKKAWRRNKVAITAGVAVAFSLVLGMTMALWMTFIAQTHEREAFEALEKAEASNLDAVKKGKLAQDERTRANQNAKKMRTRAYAADMNLAQQALEIYNLGKARQLLDRYRPVDGEEDLRGWEWRYLWGETRDRALDSLDYSNAPVTDLAVSPGDGQWVAVNRPREPITLVNRWSGKPEALPGTENVNCNKVTFSADGKWLAYAVVDQPNLPYGQGWKVCLLNVATREETDRGGLSGLCMGLQFIDQGRSLLACTTTEDEAAIVEFEVTKGQLGDSKSLLRDQLPGFPFGEYRSPFAVAPDGRLAMIREKSEGVRALDLKSGQVLWRRDLEGGSVFSVAISPDGRRVAVGAGVSNPVILLLDALTGEELSRFAGHRGFITRVRFFQSSNLLASCSADQTVRYWDLDTGEMVQVFQGHQREIWAMECLPDDSLVSASKTGEIKFWPAVQSGHETQKPYAHYDGGAEKFEDFSFSSDGRSLFVISGDRVIRRHGDMLEREEIVMTLAESSAPFFQRDGGLVASGVVDHEIQVFNVSSGQLRGRFRMEEDDLLLPVCFNLEGSGLWLMREGEDKMYEWEFGEPTPRRSVSVGTNVGESWFGLTCWQGPGGWLVGAQIGDRMWAFDSALESPKVIHWPYSGHSTFLGEAVISPQRGYVAIGKEPGVVHVWRFSDLDAGSIQLSGAVMSYHAIAFSEDDRRLVAGSGLSELLTLWETDTFQSLLTLPAADWTPRKVAFSPDKTLLVCLSGRGLHVWRAPSWEEIKAEESNGTRARD